MVRGRHVRAASGSPTPAPAQRPQPRGAAAIPQAYWTRSDSDTMIKFLLEEKSKAGDGGNFPASFWTAVSALLNPLVTRGGPKTAKVCSNKYGQFRTTYKIVKKVVDNSGWRWDDVNGAGIDETTKSSWDDYVKAHPKAKPYRNKGWPYRAAMAELMPSTVSGAHVFRPSHAAPAAATANDNDRDGEQAADIDGEVDGNADGDADGDGDEDEEMQDHNKRTGSPDWDFSNFTQSSSQNSGADHSQVFLSISFILCRLTYFISYRTRPMVSSCSACLRLTIFSLTLHL
ncbi:hypothetical protein B0H10DRAFT_1846881 [Mycena sp. CBHHK59/15]|nr:hypothetical protein B0H10DRAFT_1846881 [Mycena sp. CBHHK59/15]